MQPKDGANGIKLPGRFSLNLSLLFTSFPFRSSVLHTQPALTPTRSPLSTQRYSARWRHVKDACAEQLKQTAAARKPEGKKPCCCCWVWEGVSKGEAEEKAFNDSVFAIVLF